MKGHFLFLMIFSYGCSLGTKPLDFGSSTKADVISAQGNPLKIQKIQDNLEILIFKDDQKYQFSDEVLTHLWRVPSGEEKFLNFWKMKFKDCAVEKKQIQQTGLQHTNPLFELKCSELGLSVIYHQGNDYIERVVEYEAH